LESLADRSLVIVKFRDLVNELREQNQDLQTQLMRESASKDEVRSSIPEMLDFKVVYKFKYLSNEKKIKFMYNLLENVC